MFTYNYFYFIVLSCIEIWYIIDLHVILIPYSEPYSLVYDETVQAFLSGSITIEATANSFCGRYTHSCSFPSLKVTAKTLSKGPNSHHLGTE